MKYLNVFSVTILLTACDQQGDITPSKIESEVPVVEAQKSKPVVLNGTTFTFPPPDGGYPVELLDEYKSRFDKAESNSIEKWKLISVYTFSPPAAVNVNTCKGTSRMATACDSYTIQPSYSPKICYLMESSFFSQNLKNKDENAMISIMKMIKASLRPSLRDSATHFLVENNHALVYYHSHNKNPIGMDSVVNGIIILKGKYFSARCLTQQFVPSPMSALRKQFSIQQEILDWEKEIIPSWVNKIVEENTNE